MEIEKGMIYFYINDFGHITQKEWLDSMLDKRRAEIGNCFETDMEAIFELERLKVRAEMKGYEADGNDRYALIYDCTEDLIVPVKVSEKTALVGGIFFSSWGGAFACIQNIGYERLKKYYFRIKETD